MKALELSGLLKSYPRPPPSVNTTYLRGAYGLDHEDVTVTRDRRLEAGLLFSGHRVSLLDSQVSLGRRGNPRDA